MGARRCSPSSASPSRSSSRRCRSSKKTPQFFVPPEGVEQAFFPHVGENFFLRKDVEAEFYLFELFGEILKGFLPTVPH